ncbi:MAG: T9SS type A sorting domain-containing protein [Ignavibacteriae bacterium]|nr:T9SS type A sorting domain-containing protein [Ignavibacteriota bacterium]
MQTVAEKSFVYTIRSVAGFLWYVYKQFNIQRGYPPVITGFERNSADNNFYLGETYKITCLATGTDLKYDWFYKACDTTSFCNAPVNGLTFSSINNFYNIRNDNFRNYWTCQFYDSLCRSRESLKEYLAPESLEMFVGVRVSNQYGQVTKYFGDNHSERIYPKGFIRPPDPPINGCPVAYTLTESGYVPENNTLNKSTFPGNAGIDLTDKIILKNEPARNTSDNSLSIAINETAGDIDEFDAVRLLSIDHPENFLVAVTENNDIVFIDEQKILSPFHAEKNGEDVTNSLKYDTLYSDNVKGNEKDVIDLQFRPENSYSSKEKFVNELRNNYLITKENVFDSTAVILDPEGDHVIHYTQKRPPGYISVFDSSGIKLTGDFDFTRRERRAMTILPLPEVNFISNVQMVFKEGFGLSYCALAELLYMKNKVLENDHALINAEHSQNGEVTKYLLKEDKERSVIDSTSFLILKFRDTEKNLPRGWKRDYVLIIRGKTITQSDNRLSVYTNKILKEDVSNSIPEFRLEQNYPNPFNPSTMISYTIPEDAFVTLRIYDLLGREVMELENEYKSAGDYEVKFNSGEGKSELMSGIYFYKITVLGERGKFEKTRKMVVLR